jgi:hypothetical protein
MRIALVTIVALPLHALLACLDPEIADLIEDTTTEDVDALAADDRALLADDAPDAGAAAAPPEIASPPIPSAPASSNPPRPRPSMR